MTGNNLTIRPARAAIAAVLALSATPLLAQTVAPPVEALPVASAAPAAPMVPEAAPAAAVAPATTAPTFAASQPVVQQTQSVDERLAAAVAASEAEAAAKPAVQPRRVAAAQAPVARTRAATPATPSQPTPVATTPARETAPQAAPVAAAASEPAVAPVVDNGPPADNALLWALGAGALLLAGIGGAAMMRRRRPVEDEDALAVTPVATRTFEPVEPVAAESAIAPAPAPAVPVAARTPAMPVADSDYDRTIAAMVAEAPSKENPFLTHAKRLRRARVLLAERTVQEAPIAAATAPGDSASAQPVDRSQTVYRFGKDRAPSGILKPRTR